MFLCQEKFTEQNKTHKIADLLQSLCVQDHNLEFQRSYENHISQWANLLQLQLEKAYGHQNFHLILNFLTQIHSIIHSSYKTVAPEKVVVPFYQRIEATNLKKYFRQICKTTRKGCCTTYERTEHCIPVTLIVT